jgi:cleavage and polyadenylation specificity factor subunit 1
MAEEEIKKTAVSTPFGPFEFVGMPFGLRNATQTFQRFMDTTFRNLDFV